MASRLRLMVTAGNAAGTEIEVEDEFLIGRGAHAEGKLGDDIEISRQHARISRPAEGGYLIEDLGSTNGTRLNGRQVSRPEILSVGDKIEVGQTTLVVQYTAPPVGQVPAPARAGATTTSPVQPGAAVPPAPGEAPPTEPSPAVEPSEPVAATEPPPRLSLRLEIDFESGEAQIELDDESEPIRLVHEAGRWRTASPA